MSGVRGMRKLVHLFLCKDVDNYLYTVFYSYSVMLGNIGFEMLEARRFLGFQF